MSDLSKPQHTPTPWEAKDEFIYAPSGEHVASAGSSSYTFFLDLENAKFIVRAVNAHEALVEAAELVLSTTSDPKMGAYHEAALNARARLVAALALAKGDGE